MCEKDDYLTSYRKFFEHFAATVNPDDQLPVHVAGYTITEAELPGEVLLWTTQYLIGKECPATLMTPLRRVILDEVRDAAIKHPNDFGYRSDDSVYIALRLMQAVTSRVNEICLRYLDNAKLDTLPPPPPPPLRPYKTTSAAAKNSRRAMEDRHVEVDNLEALFGIETTEPTRFYAVYDGHAGSAAAVYCAAHLHQYLVESPFFKSDLTKALREAYVKTDNEFISKSDQERACGGSTAVSVAVRGRTLVAAWCGDSQALLAKRMRLMQLVSPHKPSRVDERERIESSGGNVMFWGTWRVNGQLAVSRAIGDVQYKPYVTSKPEIEIVELDGDEDFVVIACDGLWDFVSEDQVALAVYWQLSKNPDDLKAVTEKLIAEAKRQGSTDNITAIVVFLKEPRDIAADNGSPPMDLGLDNALASAPPPFADGEACRRQLITEEVEAAVKDAAGLHADNGLEHSDSDSEDLGPETAVDVDDLDSESRNDAAPPTPPAHTVEPVQLEVGLVDNVADSGEDSEDEWNYYKGQGQDRGDNNPSEEPLSETPCQDNSAWESSSVDMNSSPLNPDAPVFVPTVGGDVVLAESPRKPRPMDDVDLPDVQQFQTDADGRPHELVDLDNCDQLNGHHNISLNESKKEHLNGNGEDKCAMDSLGFGFGVGKDLDKNNDNHMIENFERIQKDTTDFCNIEVPFEEAIICLPCHNLLTLQENRSLGHDMICIACGKSVRSLHHHPVEDDVHLLHQDFAPNLLGILQVYQAQTEINPFACEANEELLERLKNKERDPMSMSFYQEKDDDTCERLRGPEIDDLNSVQILPDSEEEDVSPDPEDDKENLSPHLHTNNHYHEQPNNLLDLQDNIIDNANLPTDLANMQLEPTLVSQETIQPTDTPESHKLLFEQIPEIPDGKSSELGFVDDMHSDFDGSERIVTPHDDRDEREIDDRIVTPMDEIRDEREIAKSVTPVNDLHDERQSNARSVTPMEGLRDDREVDDRIVSPMDEKEDEPLQDERVTSPLKDELVDTEKDVRSITPFENERVEYNNEVNVDTGAVTTFNETANDDEMEIKTEEQNLSESQFELKSETVEVSREENLLVEQLLGREPSPLGDTLHSVPHHVQDYDFDRALVDEPSEPELQHADTQPLGYSPFDNEHFAQERHHNEHIPNDNHIEAKVKAEHLDLHVENNSGFEVESKTEQTIAENVAVTSFEECSVAINVVTPEPVVELTSEPEIASEPKPQPVPEPELAPAPTPEPTPETAAELPAELAPDVVPESCSLVTDLDAAPEVCVSDTSELQLETTALNHLTDTAISVAPAAVAAAAVAAVATVAVSKTPVTKKTTATKTTPLTKTPTAKTAPKTPVSKTTPAKTPVTKSAVAKSSPETKTSVTKSAAAPKPTAAAAKAPPKRPVAPVAAAAKETPATKPPPITKNPIARTTAAPKPAAAKSAAPRAATAAPRPASAAPRAGTTPAPRPAARAAPRPAPTAAPAPAPAPARPDVGRVGPRAPASRPAARPAPRPATAPAKSTAATTAAADKKPLTNGEARSPIKRPVPGAIAPVKSAPQPRPALDKPSKELANKRTLTKPAPARAPVRAAPPRTAPAKAPLSKSTAPKPVAKKIIEKKPLTNGDVKDETQPTENSLLPDVIA